MMRPTEAGAAATDARGLSDTDWDVLLAVPFAVFFLVAYADGRLAPAERRAFASIVDDIRAQADGPQDALVREVMVRISEDPSQIVSHLDGRMGAGLPFYEVLSAGRTLLDSLPEQAQALAFRDAMVLMAEEIADAWPIIGRRTNAQEQRSIDFVRDALGRPGDAGDRG